jgi:hypothetical protein
VMISATETYQRLDRVKSTPMVVYVDWSQQTREWTR